MTRSLDSNVEGNLEKHLCIKPKWSQRRPYMDAALLEC